MQLVQQVPERINELLAADLLQILHNYPDTLHAQPWIEP